MHTGITAFFALLRLAHGADKAVPHPHQGVLTKYERVPPSKYGLSLKGVTDERLRSGKPVLQLISLSGGFKRVASIQDVPAPPEVIWSRIMDLNNYPKMVESVAACKIYRTKKMLGKEEAWAEYKVCAGPFALSYFMHHTFEPKKGAMTFALDYSRLSDVTDSVGYWYVEKLDDEWSRVYYSTDSKLPAWVPGFAKDGLLSLALRKSTSWVDKSQGWLLGWA